jgi:hypothetical protein
MFLAFSFRRHHVAFYSSVSEKTLFFGFVCYYLRFQERGIFKLGTPYIWSALEIYCSHVGLFRCWFCTCIWFKRLSIVCHLETWPLQARGCRIQTRARRLRALYLYCVTLTVSWDLSVYVISVPSYDKQIPRTDSNLNRTSHIKGGYSSGAPSAPLPVWKFVIHFSIRSLS